MESGSLADDGVSPDVAIVILSDLFTNGQSDSCALKFTLAMQALEDVKDLFRIRLTESDAVICKIDLMVR